jgi:hypothetical protein
MNIEKPTAEQLKERRAAWVAALRSGRFEQCKGALAKVDCDENGYCCLGVACEIAIEMGLDLPKVVLFDKLAYGAREKTTVMPDEVVAFLGMNTNGDNGDNNGAFYNDAAPDGFKDYGCLAELNDNGATFSEIADFIESNPAGLWAEPEAK